MRLALGIAGKIARSLSVKDLEQHIRPCFDSFLLNSRIGARVQIVLEFALSVAFASPSNILRLGVGCNGGVVVVRRG